jgi:hypothetical protein
MRLSERDYDEFPEDHFPNMAPLRVFRDCRVWTAGVEHPLIVVAEDRTRRLAVFEYESVKEREPDCRRILRMPDEGSDPDGGVPAPIRPNPPPRSASGAAAPDSNG